MPSRKTLVAITMGRNGIPSMTDKQAKFVETLVDQLGYKDSPHKHVFLEKIGFKTADIEYASTLIGRLLKENRKRKFAARKSFNEKEIPTVSDLSQFVFCPASYSIKRSLSLEKDINQPIVDEDESHESYLIKRIITLKCPIDNIKEDAREHFQKIYEEQINDFRPFIESKLIYNGYSKTNSPARHNNQHNITGRPQLIFENPEGKKTIVVEKVSFKKIIPHIVWENNLIQALSYLYLFREFKCSEAVIIYWKHSVDGKWSSDRKYKMFKIYESDSNLEFLTRELSLFKKLLIDKEISFNTSEINPEKCFRCSCRTLCNHKSGLVDNLLLPYVTPEFDKKYPLFYTWAEEMELMALESEELLNETREANDFSNLSEDIDKKTSEDEKDDDRLIL